MSFCSAKCFAKASRWRLDGSTLGSGLYSTTLGVWLQKSGMEPLEGKKATPVLPGTYEKSQKTSHEFCQTLKKKKKKTFFSFFSKIRSKILSVENRPIWQHCLARHRPGLHEGGEAVGRLHQLLRLHEVGAVAGLVATANEEPGKDQKKKKNYRDISSPNQHLYRHGHTMPTLLGPAPPRPRPRPRPHLVPALRFDLLDRMAHLKSLPATLHWRTKTAPWITGRQKRRNSAPLDRNLLVGGRWRRRRRRDEEEA